MSSFLSQWGGDGKSFFDRLTRSLEEVRAAFRDIFQRNYFITDQMSKQLTTSWIRATVPLLHGFNKPLLYVLTPQFAAQAKNLRKNR